MSVAINNIRLRNEQEYQYFSNPIKPFLLKHYDFNWLNELRKKNENAYILDIVNDYRKSELVLQADILNPGSFDRVEAANMALFYKILIVSSRTLQMKDYITANTKMLACLRKNYSFKKD